MKNKKIIKILSSILLTLLLLVGCTSENTANEKTNTEQMQNVQNENDSEQKSNKSNKADESNKGGKSDKTEDSKDKQKNDNQNEAIDENGEYTSKEEVALYIHTFGKLPSNYITKKEAQEQGWDSKSGNLDQVLPGKSIGGDKFGNREELLPTSKGRKYYECDINYTGGFRNGERIVFSNDGLIFYTQDHYKTFEQLY